MRKIKPPYAVITSLLWYLNLTPLDKFIIIINTYSCSYMQDNYVLLKRMLVHVYQIVAAFDLTLSKPACP